MGILCSEANVTGCELTQTALLAHALNSFFHSNAKNLVCLHQLPVYHKQGTPAVERADFYVMNLDISNHTTIPILLSDFKPLSINDAYEETISYIVRVAEKTNNYLGLFLGLVLTGFEANLLVCVSLNDKMYVIKMFPGLLALQIEETSEASLHWCVLQSKVCR